MNVGKQVEQAIRHGDGVFLGKVLSMKENALVIDLDRLHLPNKGYYQILEAHWKCMDALHNHHPVDFVKAFHMQSIVLNTLNELFKEPDHGFLADTLKLVMVETRLLAKEADKQEAEEQHLVVVNSMASSKQKDSSMKYTKLVKTMLDSCFRATMMVRASSTTNNNISLEDINLKRSLSLPIVNHLLKVYFRLGTLHLCKNVIRSVEQHNAFPNFDSFTLADQVTYKYYIGLLALNEDNPDIAHGHLLYAYENCDPHHERNIRKILEYLIPLQLLKGVAPSRTLTHTHRLEYLDGVILSTLTGNVKNLKGYLSMYEGRFIKSGSYLTMEKLIWVGYRNLIRTICKIYGETSNPDQQQDKIPITYMIPGIISFGDSSLFIFHDDQTQQPQNEDVLEHIKCVIANLILRGWIKGYISHSKNILVLSKKDPFPKLSSS